MKIKLTFAGAMLLMLCIACNQTNSDQALNVDTKEASAETYGSFAAVDSAAGNTQDYKPEENQQQSPKQKQQQQPSNQPAANPDWDRKIIKTATLNVEVENYGKYYSVLRECVRNVGGYVAGEDQNTGTAVCSRIYRHQATPARPSRTELPGIRNVEIHPAEIIRLRDTVHRGSNNGRGRHDPRQKPG